MTENYYKQLVELSEKLLKNFDDAFIKRVISDEVNAINNYHKGNYSVANDFIEMRETDLKMIDGDPSKAFKKYRRKCGYTEKDFESVALGINFWRITKGRKVI